MNANAAVVDRDVAAPTSPGIRAIGIKRLAIYCAIGLAAAAVVAYGYHWVTVVGSSKLPMMPMLAVTSLSLRPRWRLHRTGGRHR